MDQRGGRMGAALPYNETAMTNEQSKKAGRLILIAVLAGVVVSQCYLHLILAPTLRDRTSANLHLLFGISGVVGLAAILGMIKFILWRLDRER